MATLNIEGQRVNVDDSFLHMSPVQQNSAVEEIAKSLHTSSGGSTFGQRLEKVWEHPTPGGPLWLARQAYEGIKGSIDAAKEEEATPKTMTEGDASRINQAHDALPVFAAQAASVFTPAAPEGAGGVLAAPLAGKIAARAPKPPAPAVAAAERLSGATGRDIAVPRAIASDNIAVQRAGQGIRNIPIVGDRIPKATQDLVDSLHESARSIADQYGAGSGTNVASRIGQHLQGAADAETRAATDAARRSDEALAAAHQHNFDVANAEVGQHEARSLEDARAAVGDMSPHDMGTALTQRLRAGETAARANKEALYQRAGQADASVRAENVQNVRSVVAQGLEDQGVIVDPTLTPAASRMMGELQRLSGLHIPNEAVGARVPTTADTRPAAVSVQGIEQARKRLNFLSRAASNDADRRAASAIMHQFDDWQSDAFENALFSGSDEALRTFRQARAANAEWRNRFFNDEEDADRVINRIVTGEVTPQEVANYVLGAGQIGAKGLSSRLLDRIAQATGNDPEAMQAIRGGIWNRLSQATEGAQPKAPAKVSKDIIEFLNGSGRDVAERLFTPEQRRLMRAYADTLRTGQDARTLIGEVANATQPTSMEVPRGPMQQLADAVLGKGTKSDEALFNAINSYAKSGNRADVATLAKLVQAIPQEERDNLAGSIIRNLGISPRTGEFSPDVFVSQWRTYTPQAKAVLFGNAGPQRQAIDDIATISDRLAQIGKRFGNPSGTAQNINLFGMLAAFVHAPVAAVAGGIGGYSIARLLAAPAGASSALKWSKAYSDVLLHRSPKAMGLLKVTTRNLANTARSLGLTVSPAALLAPMEGAVPAGAQQKQN